ncbi:MAG: SMC-Scp complex subunit ScpB [Candidatus Aminicenantes bacterium]|nr:SMC-Scp complex subunit ScpB [Candidatus Aminicenantes bacterium]
MTPALKEIIEALIFVSLEPLTPGRIQEVLTDIPAAEVEQVLAELLAAYEAEGHGIQILQTGGGYIFCTKPACDAWVKRLLRIDRKSKLSSASLETLSIIAYHQPITLSEISALRGVDSSYTLKTLLEKKMIRIVGRKNSPGKPLIYRTTDRFLAHFGLNSLEELPSEEEIARILGEEKNSAAKT